MQGKGSGPVNRVELESQVLCAALRQSCNGKEKIGAFTSVRELSHLFPDLLPPPEKEDAAGATSNKANYYEVIGVKPQSGANGVIAAYLRTARKFIRQNKVTDRRQEYSQILNAGFVLRKPRLRLSHDLVVARRWLHEESRLAQLAQQEVTVDRISVEAVQEAAGKLPGKDIPGADVAVKQKMPASPPPVAPATPSIPVPPANQAAPSLPAQAASPAVVGASGQPSQPVVAVDVPPPPPLPYYEQPPAGSAAVSIESTTPAAWQESAPAPQNILSGRIESNAHKAVAESRSGNAPPAIPEPVLSMPPPADFDLERVAKEEIADEDASEFNGPDIEPASVRARAAAAVAEHMNLSQAIQNDAARPSGRIGKQAAFVFDEGALRRPQAANKPTPVVIQLLEAAQIIGPLEVEALKAQMEFAPNIPVEKLILNAGYVNSQEMASIKLGESLLQQGRITMAQFQVAIYDERMSGLRMAESLQVRGWLSVEVRNAIDDWHRKRS